MVVSSVPSIISAARIDGQLARFPARIDGQARALDTWYRIGKGRGTDPDLGGSA